MPQNSMPHLIGQPGQSTTPGRKTGSVNIKRSKEAREFAALVLDSREYRESLVLRIKNGTLPTAIEQLLYHYRYGKPAEHVEVSVTPNADVLSQMSNEELAARAEALAQIARTSQETNKLVTEPGGHSVEVLNEGTAGYGLAGAFELTDLPSRGTKH